MTSFDPMTLYRGVDEGKIEADFVGEKRLLWTSEKPIDAANYAMGGRPREATLIRYTVLRFMVYERSGWPVVRLEDMVDQTPFIDQVATLRITPDLATAIERHVGSPEKWMPAVKRKHPGLLTGTADVWKRG